MTETTLLHELIEASAERCAYRPAVTFGSESFDYQSLHETVSAFAGGLLALGAAKSDRIGIYLEKRIETVVAMFGAAAAGAVFVPLNPLLKPAQVGYILRDCNVRVLVTSRERLALLDASLSECPDLRHIVVIDAESPVAPGAGMPVHAWRDLTTAKRRPGHRVIDTDMAAILYTSGSTGRPKGVVLSHRNMVAG